MIDVQKPAAFGKEKEDAEAVGAKVRWPVFTRQITKNGVVLDDGELLKADTVVVSIGDIPDLDFLDDSITIDNIKVEAIPDIMAYGVRMTPALVIDDEVKSVGKLPGPDKIASWIQAAAE